MIRERRYVQHPVCEDYEYIQVLCDDGVWRIIGTRKRSI